LYSKEEASQLKQAFWTAFGQYIAPHLSADGIKTNWVNYKTGIKHVHFKMQADKQFANIAIEIAHPDHGIQELFFEQFKEFKNILHTYTNEDWAWDLHGKDEYGKTVSRIFKKLDGVNIFNKNDWPALISFFKPRIIALDEFWSNVKYGFDSLK
jgi:hypothetical protein